MQSPAERPMTATLTAAQWQTIVEIFDKQVVHSVAAPILQALMSQLQSQQAEAAPTLKEVS